MAAKFEEIKTNLKASLFTGVFQDNLDTLTWHYHNNYELSFITEGNGRRIVADSIEDFYPGDMVLLGKNLPHLWIAEKSAHTLTNRNMEMVFVQFTADLFFPQTIKLPEFSNIKHAIYLSERGIKITGDTLNQVSSLMLELPYLNSFDRIISFYRMMDIIGRSSSNIVLASNEYQKSLFPNTDKRIAAIHRYLMNNYRNEVTLHELANEVNMAEGSLCRFFKAQIGISIFEYLNKIKIDLARNLLLSPDLSILEIAIDSGFNNISHFNKQFKKATGSTPSQYRKNHQFS